MSSSRVRPVEARVVIGPGLYGRLTARSSRRGRRGAPGGWLDSGTGQIILSPHASPDRVVSGRLAGRAAGGRASRTPRGAPALGGLDAEAPARRPRDPAAGRRSRSDRRRQGPGPAGTVRARGGPGLAPGRRAPLAHVLVRVPPQAGGAGGARKDSRERRRAPPAQPRGRADPKGARKSTRLNSSH